VNPVCGYCGKEHPGRCAAWYPRPTLVAAPHAQAKLCGEGGCLLRVDHGGPCEQRPRQERTARDDEPTTVGVERRRCRRCSAPIEPDAVEGERFPGEAAAWLAGFCTSRCAENDATEAVANGTAWWLGRD
jgi:hypothetical protein